MSDSATAASKQVWSATAYETNARFVADLGADILSWLAPSQGERILDLGCGDGALTQKIVEAGAVVVGVDASENLLAAARKRGIDARFMDGQALEFDHEFDAVFSNAALHWMAQAPDAVVAGVARALKPGGRFVAEFGGQGNVASIVVALRSAAWAFGGDESLAGPWFYPTPDEYRALLEAAGFTVDRIELRPRPTPLATGVEGWLLTFRKVFFDQFDAETQPKVLAHVVNLLKPNLCDKTGHWTADYVRLKVAARV